MDNQEDDTMKVPASTIRELERAYSTAKDYADAWNDAAKAAAEKHEVDPQGLKRFIRAKHADKLEKLQAELDTVDQLTLNLRGDQADMASRVWIATDSPSTKVEITPETAEKITANIDAVLKQKADTAA